MSSITFASGTVVPASWLNDVNGLVYNGTVISTQLLGPLGAAGSPTYSFAAETGTGLFRRASGTLGIQINGNSVADFNALGNGGLYTNQLSLDRTNGDVILVRDAANILAQKNGAVGQAIRIYGTTTGPKYLSVSHDGTNAVIDTAAASGALNIGLTNATSVNVKNLGGATPDTGAFTTASTTGLLTANSATVTNTLTANALIDASGASAGQIKFPAAQNASANVNTLDDYEEGTWTPSVGGTATYLSQFGEYVKIGHTVYIWGSMQINVIGTGSTNQISGLPFTCVPTNNHNTFISLECTNASAVSLVSNSALINNNATTINLMGRTAAATSATTQNMMGNSTTLIFSGQYLVAN